MIGALIGLLFVASASLAAEPAAPPLGVSVSQPLGLLDALRMAESYSPDLKAAHQGERAASEGIRISESAYFPTLDLVAVNSTGFPASATAPLGFNGLMMSPYRSGGAIGAFTTVTLFDLTREFGVAASKAGLQAAKEESEVTRLHVDLTTMNLYLDALRSRHLRDIWSAIGQEVDRLEAVVKKFVRNGQYSLVTEWLLKDQSERARQQQEVFEQARQASVQRLEILMGVPAGSVSLAPLPSLDLALSEIQNHLPAESPLVIRPRLQAQTSREFASQAAAQNWPRLLGIASAGTMEHSRLEPLQDYSAWIGLSFPIFEGFRIAAQTSQAQAAAERQENLSEQASVELSDADARLSEEARVHEIEIEHVQKEIEYATQALRLAEHRYVTFVGDLADVRDSLRSYEDAESELATAQVELYRLRFAKAIIDGAR